jgi:hypothetical protein
MNKKIFLALLAVLAIALLAIGCQQKELVSPEKVTTSEPVTTPTASTEPSTGNNEFVAAEEIKCNGPNGFSPAETTTLKNVPIYFVNEYTKDMVMTIQKEGTSKFITTPIIKPGEKYKVQLNEEGEYTFWETNYVPRGKIIIK